MPFDNLCKYLAETYPERFAAWLLGEVPTDLSSSRKWGTIAATNGKTSAYDRVKRFLMRLD